MDFRKVKVTLGQRGRQCRLEIDGEPVKNCIRFEIVAYVNEVTRLKVWLLGIEGEAEGQIAPTALDEIRVPLVKAVNVDDEPEAKQ